MTLSSGPGNTGIWTLFAGSTRARGFTSHDEFYAYTLELNRRILRSPLYRALGALLSPSRMLKGAQLAWSRMHRGSHVEVTMLPGANAGTITFHHPRGVFTTTFLRCFATAAVTALEVGGAASVDAKVAALNDTTTLYDVTWR